MMTKPERARLYSAFIRTPLWETDEIGYPVVTDPDTGEHVDVMTREQYDQLVDDEALSRAENGYVRWLETRDADYYQWCDRVERALGRVH
jgi:hypothetical protein